MNDGSEVKKRQEVRDGLNVAERNKMTWSACK